MHDELTGQFLSDTFNVTAEFPILKRVSPVGESLIYLDSAATALKPQCVIDAVTTMLSRHTANIHRSVHYLGDEATQAYESTRDLVATFINSDPYEVVFLKNTTEALNLVANTYNDKGRIISSYGEHHSNFLPWNVNIYRLSLDDNGNIDFDELERKLEKRDVCLVSLAQASNVTGNITDIKKVVDLAHHFDAKVMVDAAQSAPHLPIDVMELDCDFLAFSGHKLGSPTGVGVLYGKADLLEELNYFQIGGSTIEEVHADGYVAKNAPWKFEAGTPAIECVAGLKAAISFLLQIGMENVNAHFNELSNFAAKEVRSRLPENCLIGGQGSQPHGPFSFNFKGISPHVLARGLSDRYGICVRSGFHCAQPLHELMGFAASLRISFWIYNSKSDIEKAIDGIVQLTELVDRN